VRRYWNRRWIESFVTISSAIGGLTARSAGALVSRMIRQVEPADRVEPAHAFGVAPVLVAEG